MIEAWRIVVLTRDITSLFSCSRVGGDARNCMLKPVQTRSIGPGKTRHPWGGVMLSSLVILKVKLLKSGLALLIEAHLRADNTRLSKNKAPISNRGQNTFLL